MAGKNTASRVLKLIEEPVRSIGISIWDVRLVKEGASWYLRIYIDKPGGVTIDDCTEVSHLIDPILDEADPIDMTYYLEVCSPGIDRELKTEEHFKAFIGSKITVTLYKAVNGSKTVTGVLEDFDNGPVIKTESGVEKIDFSSLAGAKVCSEIK